MSRGSHKKHDRLVSLYKHPTNNMLRKIGLCSDDIITIHSELSFSKLLQSYGCYSNKTPDLIYKTEIDGELFYYVGEIKSGRSVTSKARAADKAMIYSKILNDYDIPHKPFIITGYEQLALPAEQIYTDFLRRGFYNLKPL